MIRSFLFIILLSAGLASAGYFDTLKNVSGNPWLALARWQYTPVPGLGEPPFHAQTMGWEKCDFADAINSMVYQAGFDMVSSEPQNALMAYSGSENRWRLLDVGPGASSKSEYVLNSGHDRRGCYDSRIHAFEVLGVGAFGNIQNGHLEYDVRGNTGRCYYPAPGYSTQGGDGGSCFDTDSGCYYYLGGSIFSRFRASSNEWKRLSNSPVIACNQELPVGLVYDKKDRKVVAFSCAGGVWSYDPSLNSWASVATTSHVSEDYPDVIWNDLMRKCVVFDKTNGRTYSYDLGTNTWTEICQPTTYSINKGHVRTGLTFSPYDNLYMDAAPGGAGEYGTKVYVMRDSNRTPLPLPVFDKLTWIPMLGKRLNTTD